MVKILFICHGNICRSPMAEFICRDLIVRRGLEDQVTVASAATSDEETGNPVYPPAREILRQHGLSCAGKTARRVTRADFDYFDLLIVMESFNIRNLRNRLPDADFSKVHRLLDYTAAPGDIDDPWYTRDFATAYRQIAAGCAALLDKLFHL